MHTHTYYLSVTSTVTDDFNDSQQKHCQKSQLLKKIRETTPELSISIVPCGALKSAMASIFNTPLEAA